MVITIDGETYTMKSTIAGLIAKRFSFVHLSNGVFYRALTYIAIKAHIDLSDELKIVDFCRTTLKSLKLSSGKLFFRDEEIDGEKLGGKDVFMNCSVFSGNKEVVDLLNGYLRDFAANRNVVIDGRESGTTVFPDAAFKFYFVADTKRFNPTSVENAERLNKLKRINDEDKKAGIIKKPADAVTVAVENFDDAEAYAKRISDMIVQKITASINRGESYALVPARSGSRGCPNKNIKKLCGHALIKYPIKVAEKLPEISKTVFTSDSPEYGDMAKSFGACVPFLRPEELSSPTSTDLDFFTHAVYMLYGLNKSLPEYFVFLRATSPLRDPEIVKDVLNILKKNGHATSIRTAHEAAKSPYKMFSLGDDGCYHSLVWDVTIDEINVPRQILPKAYVPNGYVDVFKSENIVRTHTLYGEKVLAYETDEVIDVDTAEDFEKAEKIISKNPKYRIFD